MVWEALRGTNASRQLLQRTCATGVGTGEIGTGQVDWSGFAKLYLDPGNLAGAGPLADQHGKVAKTYGDELYDWLTERFGYGGTKADALGYFLALPDAQQRIFLRQVYYAELTAGGREYNQTGGPRAGSYLRGREAIAALCLADPRVERVTVRTSKPDVYPDAAVGCEIVRGR